MYVNLVIGRPLTPQVPMPTRPVVESGVAKMLLRTRPLLVLENTSTHSIKTSTHHAKTSTPVLHCYTCHQQREQSEQSEGMRYFSVKLKPFVLVLFTFIFHLLQPLSFLLCLLLFPLTLCDGQVLSTTPRRHDMPITDSTVD